MRWSKNNLLAFVLDLMLVALGLYLMGVRRALAFSERAGQRLWQRLQPLSRRFLPAMTALMYLAVELVYLLQAGAARAALCLLSIALAVLAAVCIFALPAFFFGMITPYTIRLRIESVDSSGATVGRLYALSTAGSIVGTFLGGFILISYWGSTTILWGVAACMLGLSLCNGGGRVRLRAVLLAVCGLMAVVAASYGRWTTLPYKLLGDDREAIAYAQPLILDDGTVYGVLGVELLESYMDTKLPVGRAA